MDLGCDVIPNNMSLCPMVRTSLGDNTKRCTMHGDIWQVGEISMSPDMAFDRVALFVFIIFREQVLQERSQSMLIL